MFKPSQSIKAIDTEIFDAIYKEAVRQEAHIELIASENYVSRAILETQGSILTNKYAEGYPHKRYYGGCEHVDVVEALAISRAQSLFGASYANVQPHSGSQANAAVYQALLNPGDTVLGMSLPDGGHLTHGAKVNFSGKLYEFFSYGVDSKTHLIDYDVVESLAIKHRPKLIVAGFSAYSRVIDWAAFRRIADKVGAYLMVDMAHVAGLVAANLYPNPVSYADVVTSTTHKTLRGPRGGLILAGDNPDLHKKLNSAVFPGLQGGPLMHVIAAKAVAFLEAMSDSFKAYQRQVIKNAQLMASVLQNRGYNIVSGGTDNHLLLVDLTSKDMTGKTAENILGSLNITVNKNTVPNETQSPFVTSGIRLGTPAITSRGFCEAEILTITECIIEALTSPNDEVLRTDILNKIQNLCDLYPVYN